MLKKGDFNERQKELGHERKNSYVFKKNLLHSHVVRHQDNMYIGLSSQ